MPCTRGECLNSASAIAEILEPNERWAAESPERESGILLNSDAEEMEKAGHSVEE